MIRAKYKSLEREERIEEDRGKGEILERDVGKDNTSNSIHCS